MIYQGKEEELFESEERTNDLVAKYYVILTSFEKKAPLPERFIEAFQKRYNITLTEAEYLELREYAETDYREDIPNQIQSDFEEGFYKLL